MSLWNAKTALEQLRCLVKCSFFSLNGSHNCKLATLFKRECTHRSWNSCSCLQVIDDNINMQKYMITLLYFEKSNEHLPKVKIYISDSGIGSKNVPLEGIQYKIQLCSLVSWENIFQICLYFLKAKASGFCRTIFLDSNHSSLLGMTSHLWDVQCLKCVNTVLTVH